MTITRWLAVRQPALAAVIVGTLALGIGAATALYSVMEAVILRPFPFRDQGRLVLLWQADVVRNHPFVELSYPEVRDWGTRTEVFESVAAMSSVNFDATLTGAGEPRQVPLRAVGAPFFDVLGATPLIGRTLTADDHRAGAGRVAVIGHPLWHSAFGGDPGVVGRPIVLDGDTHTIVGVMPRDFRYPDAAEIWTPVELAVSPNTLENRGVRWMIAVGRLQNGVDPEQARAALDATVAALAKQYRPQETDAMRGVMRPLVGEILGTTRNALLALLCAVGSVLFIACANVINLLLSRSVDRRREIATRLALGASRSRLARQLLGEVLPLAAAGGTLGVLIAWWGLRFLVRIGGAELPRGDDIALNVGALGVAAGLSLGSGVLCALAPMFQSRDVSVASALREDRRTGTSRVHRRLRDWLVTAEIALALVLLVGSVLLIASFVSLQRQDLGFRPERLIAVEGALSSPRNDTIEKARVFQRQTVERIRALPGVEAASAVLIRPLWGTVGYDWLYVLEGQTQESASRNPIVNLESAVPGYFSTMGIRMTAGRDFTEQDHDNAPGVIIVSEDFARTLWPGKPPLGQRLRIPMPSSRLHNQWLTVVGVVGDVHYREIEKPRLDMYLPYGQFTGPVKHVMVRTSGDARLVLVALRNLLQEIEPGRSLDIRVMEDVVSTAMGRWRLNARLFGALALMALLLAAVGTYSVMAYAVSRRTQEIGVRVALGAGRHQIAQLVFGDGARLAIWGIGIGSIGAVGAAGALKHLLFGISPHQPAVFASAALVLFIVALTACLLPARRATTVDPMVAMRVE
jgi:putative ABC transport system permease protein